MTIVFRRLPTVLKSQQCTLTLIPNDMRAWEIPSFSSTAKQAIEQQLQMTNTRRTPPISKPSDVLVRVQAASLNPIDSLVLTGYGASAFRSLRNISNPLGNHTDFPLTPGCDFAGEVVINGPDASDLEEGAQVIGTNWPHACSVGGGSLAEFVVCPREYLARRPNEGVSPTVATALGYAGLTALMAVEKTGIRPGAKNHQPRVLVTGVSGAVGSLAAQMLRLRGVCDLTVTCSSSANENDLKALLHANEVIFAPDQPSADSRYDLIIDCVRPRFLTDKASKQPLDFLNVVNYCPLLKYLEPGCNSRYIVLNPPVLSFIDQLGITFGLGGSAITYLSSVIQSPPASVYWVFFRPSGLHLQQLTDLVAQGRIHVPIDSVFAFNEAKLAFSKMLQRGNNGKIVVTVP